jgi:hypothetical protein
MPAIDPERTLTSRPRLAFPLLTSGGLTNKIAAWHAVAMPRQSLLQGSLAAFRSI